MYGKIFESTFTGSMFGAGPVVFALWAYIIAHTNQDHQVEINPRLVAACLGASLDEVAKALALLTGPDPQSRTPDHDGARIVHISAFVYHVVNHEKYRTIRNEDERREYNREAQKRHRQSKSKSMSMTVNEKSAVSAHTEADTETEAKTSSLPSPGGDIHVRARTRVQEDPATATAKILESGNKKIQGCDQDAVRKALADGDLLALVRAYGANDSRGHEWARDAAGRKLGRIAIVLDWAQRSRRPIREPSGLRSALVDWDSLLSAEQIEISQEWAEGLGIRSQKADSVPQEAISPQDPAQDRGEEDRAAESRETALEGKQPQPHESAKEEITQ